MGRHGASRLDVTRRTAAGFARVGRLSLRVLSQFRQVPDLDRVVATSRVQSRTRRVEHEAANEPGVAAEGANELVIVMAVPNLDRAILPRRGEPATVGAERDGVNLPLVSEEGGQYLPTAHDIPDSDRVLLAA